MGAPFLRRFTLKKETVLSAFRLTAGEFALWAVSAALIVVSFLVFDGSGYLTLAASLVGVTSLIFCARGNPLGLALMVVFSLLYGLISLGFRYYGEMLTYLGMTMPMSVYSLVVWLRHPYAGSRTQVAVRRTRPRDWLVMGVLAAAVTAAFFFILRAEHGESGSQHRVRHHQLCRGLSHRPQEHVLCAGLRRKRRRPDRPVASGRGRRSGILFRGRLLCRIPDQRPLRFSLLAAHGAAAGGAPLTRGKFIGI